MAYYNTIAESNNFIVLDDYEKYSVLNEPSVVYQTEASLEHEFIQDLRNQGYEYLPDLNTPEALLANVRTQLQALNDVEFTDSEWDRYSLSNLNVNSRLSSLELNELSVSYVE